MTPCLVESAERGGGFRNGRNPGKRGEMAARARRQLGGRARQHTPPASQERCSHPRHRSYPLSLAPPIPPLAPLLGESALHFQPATLKVTLS
jgi:hypothetical protein